MSDLHLIDQYGLRDFVELKDKCWIWKGNYGRTKKGRKPVGMIKGKGPRRDIRKFLAEKAGLTICRWTPLKNSCDDFRCVSPSCIWYPGDRERIMNRIKSMLKYIKPSEDGCLRWLGGKSGRKTTKYAKLKVNGKMVQVIRLLVEAKGVKLWGDDQASHLCGQSDCCNEDHLMAATPSMNIRFRYLQSKKETKMSIDEAREWHLREYRKERPDWLIKAIDRDCSK